jgi:AbiTii
LEYTFLGGLGKNPRDAVIPPSRQALAEALALSGEILRNIELSELPLTNIALKVSRLARLLNEIPVQKIMEYEAGGYPTQPTGVPPDVWQSAITAGRKFESFDPQTKQSKEYIYSQSIGELEELLRLGEAWLAAARDPDVAISSANPQQMIFSPSGNAVERNTIRQSITLASQRLASRRTLLYRYTLRKHYELKFSGVADDVFTRIRDRVDATIGRVIPDAVQRLTAVYDNLRSDNPEDWSNAVHSCRRVLQDLADVVFPCTEDERVKAVGGKTIRIKLGRENYINRILAFVEDRSTSGRFEALVGSQLSFLGDGLDSIFKAAQKGSHDTIVSREEADRYVVYTYLIVGDILSLYQAPSESV